MAVLLVMSFLAVPVRADVFLLHNGRQIEGEWLNPDQSPRQEYEIRTEQGITLALAASQVREVVRQSPMEQSYQRAVHAMPHTLDAHWLMAEKCREAGMNAERAFHLEQVLTFDPDHADARRLLGYSLIDDRWVKPDEFMQQQGYVRYKGQWRLPQEVEIESRVEQWEQEDKQWRQDTRRWRSWIVRGKDVEQALESFRAIRSPRAAPALKELLEEPQENKQLKLLYIDLLGQMLRSGSAVDALVNRILEDDDEDIVDRCLRKLAEDDAGKYVPLFVARLGSKDNEQINRAALALGRLGDASAIPALIEALRTKHKTLVTGPSMSTGFSPGGGGGLSTGGGTKILERTVENRSVLNALALLTPDGINFGYNQSAWLQWYVQSNLPPTYDLRRGH